jgi:soluble cytochrome b562
MKLARCQYLKETVPGPSGPFSEISGWAKEDTEEAIQEAGDKLKEKLDDMLHKVQKAFEKMKRKKENDTPEGKKFRTGLHELVAEARLILSGVAKESLDLCNQYK